MDERTSDPDGRDPDGDDSNGGDPAGARTDGYDLEPAPPPPPSPSPPSPSPPSPPPPSPSPLPPTSPDPSSPDASSTAPASSDEFDRGGVDPKTSTSPASPAPASIPVLPTGSWRPWAITAGVLLGLETIAILAGWSSFFPQVDGRFLDAAGKPVLDAPEIADRFVVAGRLILTVVFMVGCVVPAFHATAFFETRPVGDRATGLARIGLAVTLAALVRLVPLGGGLLQTWMHLGLGLLVLVGSVFLLLRLRGPSLTLLMVGWGIAYVVLGIFARLLTWGVPLF